MSLVDIANVSGTEIVNLLDSAEELDRERFHDHFSRRIVVALFMEPSTRTRFSFEIATRRLGSDFVTFDDVNSSAAKGEALRDTVLTLAAMKPDVFVIRHQNVGVPEMTAKWSGIPVINAGDGRRAHPTQTLADLLTLRRSCGSLEELKVGIVGDVTNSRVARGLLSTLPRVGAEVTVIGPPTFLPSEGKWQVETSNDLDESLPGLDVVYALRVQKERGAEGSYPSDAEYRRRFGLTRSRLAAAGSNLRVLHAGPMNRGVEVDDEVADSEQSLVLDQVAAGVAVRMAVLAKTLEDDL